MAVLEATVLVAPKWASDMLDVIVPAELTPLELPTLPGLHEELTGEGVDVLLATDNGNDGSEGVGAVDEELVEFCRRTLANSAKKGGIKTEKLRFFAKKLNFYIKFEEKNSKNLIFQTKNGIFAPKSRIQSIYLLTLTHTLIEAPLLRPIHSI